MRLPMGRGTRRAGGGISITGIIVILLISWITGINPLELLAGSGGLGGGQEVSYQQPAQPRSAKEEELAKFVSVVLADTETTWESIFSEGGRDYPHPTLVLFSGAVRSACGQATSAVGPFYCGADQQIYIDLGFYNQLAAKLNAPGDFAQAYVLAHEVGHHVQNVLGILGEFHKAKRSMSEKEGNALSVRIELQADCFAGVWAHYAARQKGFVEDGDIDEALNAASQIGDDTLQKRSQGYVVPDSFNHGTSDQRKRWFRTGFSSGSVNSCDTLNARSL
jgi:predicted metalloprotease